MFNQKVNAYTSQNPDYLNHSLGAPAIRALDIHNCGTTIQKYKLEKQCNSLPLQTWCSKGVAVESFAMRPIVNSKEYFENIQKFLSSIIFTDSIPLKQSNLSSERYKILLDYGREPESSFLQAINLQVTDRLMYLMGQASSEMSMFKDYNPIGEGLVMTDISIDTYQSTTSPVHFHHKLMFSVVNTTRYNTISFKAEAYQDTSGMMENWNKNINEVKNSKNVSKDTNGGSAIYISNLGLLNNTMCVLGQESDCQFKGYNLKGSWSQLLNDNLLATPTNLNWMQPNAITENTYSNAGNYDTDGSIKIIDYGPDNIEDLIKSLKVK
jgi:hypothetical protein